MTEQLYVFISHSKNYSGKQLRELNRIQETGWSIQNKMCSMLKDTFESIYVTLYLVSSSNSGIGLEAKRLLHSLTKTCITYNKISFLSDYLHPKDMDYALTNNRMLFGKEWKYYGW